MAASFRNFIPPSSEIIKFMSQLYPFLLHEVLLFARPQGNPSGRADAAMNLEGQNIWIITRLYSYLPTTRQISNYRSHYLIPVIRINVKFVRDLEISRTGRAAEAVGCHQDTAVLLWPTQPAQETGSETNQRLYSVWESFEIKSCGNEQKNNNTWNDAHNWEPTWNL